MRDLCRSIRRLSTGLAARGVKKSAIHQVASDSNACYVKVFEFDISKLSPQVAKPHTVDNNAAVES